MTSKELYERMAAIRAALPATVVPEFDALLLDLTAWDPLYEPGPNSPEQVVRRFLRDHGSGQ